MTGEKSKSGSKRLMVFPMVSRLRRSYRDGSSEEERSRVDEKEIDA